MSGKGMSGKGSSEKSGSIILSIFFIFVVVLLLVLLGYNTDTFRRYMNGEDVGNGVDKGLFVGNLILLILLVLYCIALLVTTFVSRTRAEAIFGEDISSGIYAAGSGVRIGKKQLYGYYDKNM